MFRFVLFVSITIALVNADAPVSTSGNKQNKKSAKTVTDNQSGFIPSSAPLYPSNGQSNGKNSNLQDVQSYGNSHVSLNFFFF